MVLQNVCVLCVLCAGRAYVRRGIAVADVRPESARSAADGSASVTKLHGEQQLSARACRGARAARVPPCCPLFPPCPHPGACLHDLTA